MKTLVAKAVRFLRSADGPTAVEYAVILTLIFLVCIAAIEMVGKTTNSSFQHSKEQINSSFGQGN